MFLATGIQCLDELRCGEEANRTLTLSVRAGPAIDVCVCHESHLPLSSRSTRKYRQFSKDCGSENQSGVKQKKRRRLEKKGGGGFWTGKAYLTLTFFKRTGSSGVFEFHRLRDI